MTTDEEFVERFSKYFQDKDDNQHGLKFYCECCGSSQPVLIENISKEPLNEKPWGDVVCKTCSFVIVTVSADVEGVLEFRKNPS